MSQSKRGRGRPKVYAGNQKRYIVGLIRQNGLTGAANILNASVNTTAEDFEKGSDPEAVATAVKTEHELATGRNQKMVPADQPLGISMPTLGKLAKEAGISLKRGRPRKTDADAVADAKVDAKADEGEAEQAA